MKTIKKISISGAALLMAASMGSAYADEAEMTQTRERSEFNLQTPSSDFGQSRMRVQNMVINKNQEGSDYAHEGEMKQTRTQTRERAEFNLQTPTSDFGQSRSREQNMVTDRFQNSYAGESTMNRQATMNRSMQNSAVSGSMNRQATANRSMSSGRR